jgi:hypothetical protein
MRIHVEGAKHAIEAFADLPARMQFKHIRIALNAAGGVIRDRAAQIVPRESGLLRRSLAVKVKIPNASFNQKHWGKPEYAVIGARRRFTQAVTFNKSGKARSISREGVFTAAFKGRTVKRRKPSRYLHLVEKGTPHVMARPFLDTAVRTEGGVASAKAITKLKQGLAQEANNLYATR